VTPARLASGRFTRVTLRGTALLLLAWAAPRASAQDFAAGTPAGVPGAAALLESGLAPASASTRLELLATRWLGLPELETRAAALSVGWRSLRAAAGVSATGTAELGWNAAGVAFGAARGGSGAALRAVGRRDRVIASDGDPAAAGSGAEAGGGVWISDGSVFTVWAADPQLWCAGAAPPLRRALVLGVRFEFEDVSVWLAREAVLDAAAGVRGEHTVGASLRAGPLVAWLEARDQPLRASLGVAARLPGLAVLGAVDSHPVLDQTIHLGLRFGRAELP